MMKRGLAQINKLRDWHVVLLFIAVGFAVFFTGLNNPFQGDDQPQIVDNPVVHSISHIATLFGGSTFYNGGGPTTPLSGTYYRPLMSVTFSLLYTFFGPHSLPFHLLQTILVIGSAILLYLVFKRLFLNNVLSLALALIFLVHPLNSQVVFAIPSMQDALCFFFGILSFWILLRYESSKSLYIAGITIFLSLLSKESGVLFVIMTPLYLYWFDRKRLSLFAKVIVGVLVMWVLLKASAVGLFGANPDSGPIDRLSLLGRLMTMPSIMLFYLTKFVFPWTLATQYHWVYPTFSLQHVLLPFVGDIAFIALVIALGWVINKKASEKDFRTYLFFALWTGLGIAIYLQFIPLDMTVCENWFYFTMAGVLGLIAVTLTSYTIRINPRWILLVVLLITALGIRTAIRGTDYNSVYKLDTKDTVNSRQDYNAYTGLAQISFKQGDYAQARAYSEKSIDIFPYQTNYEDLGAALLFQGDYAGSHKAYQTGLKYGNYSQLYDDLSQLTLVYGTPNDNQKFFASATKQYPHDSYLWTYCALFYYRYGIAQNAKEAITIAIKEGQVSPFTNSIYTGIMKNIRIAVRLGKATVIVPQSQDSGANH